jgi:hypothetical protein
MPCSADNTANCFYRVIPRLLKRSNTQTRPLLVDPIITVQSTDLAKSMPQYDGRIGESEAIQSQNRNYSKRFSFIV